MALKCNKRTVKMGDWILDIKCGPKDVLEVSIWLKNKTTAQSGFDGAIEMAAIDLNGKDWYDRASELPLKLRL